MFHFSDTTQFTFPPPSSFYILYIMSMPKPIESVFKQADGIDIYMDIYLPDAATKENPAPILLWWHGASYTSTLECVVSHYWYRWRFTSGINHHVLNLRARAKLVMVYEGHKKRCVSQDTMYGLMNIYPCSC